MVSQVVADSLAKLLLEGCRDTRCVHGGSWRERVKKYTPPGLTSSIRIAVSAVKDFWVAYTVHRQVKVDTLKYTR